MLITPIPTEKVSWRYAVATLSAVLAVLLRWALDPILGHVAFYVTIYIVVAYCAVLCGLGPAILTGVVGFLGVFYWFVDPRHSLMPIRPSEVHGVVGFVLVTAVLMVLGEATRNKQSRLNSSIVALRAEARERQRAEDELRRAHDELELRVRQRTSELTETLSRLQAEVKVREDAESQLRQLSLRLMTLQDEERRHIARELHDSAGQTIAAMKMSIALIRRIDPSLPALQPLIDDLNALADNALQEIRTTSYLLHPPLLDESGVASAARWFVEGFARRSGIHVHCDIPQKMERPSRHCELVLFRVLQESLTNVHRHSSASDVSVRLRCQANRFELEIADNGRGIPEDRLLHFHASGGNSGVGVTGMRERVRELGGQFEISSRNTGTTVRVLLPVASRPAAPNPATVA